MKAHGEHALSKITTLQLLQKRNNVSELPNICVVLMTCPQGVSS